MQVNFSLEITFDAFNLEHLVPAIEAEWTGKALVIINIEVSAIDSPRKLTN
jgi:hypothetical protein